MPDLAFDSRHAVLLVMDYQNGLIASLPDSDGLLGNVRTAVDLVRSKGGYIGYVRVGFTPEELSRIPARSPMAMAATPERQATLAFDAVDTQIHDRIAPEPGDIVVRKTRVGAFSTTDLAMQLDDRQITTVVLAGIATSGVVLSTVRDAADRDFRIVVVADGCADRDPEVHAFLTERVFPRQALVTTVEDLGHLLGANDTPVT
jgi:nicotinamidase-related amidase